MTQGCRWVVSVEGLSVPARAAVLKALQHRLGLMVADNDHQDRQDHHPFSWLLHRMRGLAKVPISADALWCGSWLMHVPRGSPALTELYKDVSHVLADRLPEEASRTKHLMVWLDVDPNQAFETLFHDGNPAAREVNLQCLRDARDTLLRAVRDAMDGNREALYSPFEVQIVHIPYPPFAADNPVTLNAVLDLVEDECLKAMRD